MTLAHILDGLRCACCGGLNVLWLDAVRGLVECRQCGERAGCLVDCGEAA
ncbi:hypothetical protein [Sphaerisporangium sp. TRM90804]|nr:hypothetical protein [Sphaerisporangium sp. TRM90804]MDH2429286.1 hypothetical protein [Sphaerisporangium sp. TRM90804]